MVFQESLSSSTEPRQFRLKLKRFFSHTRPVVHKTANARNTRRIALGEITYADFLKLESLFCSHPRAAHFACTYPETVNYRNYACMNLMRGVCGIKFYEGFYDFLYREEILSIRNFTFRLE